MLNKLVHTLGSRAIMAVFNLIMLLITTRWMGPEPKGEISMLILNLTLGALLSGVVGGPALVYLTPRNSIRSLLLVNHTWTLLCTAPLVGVLIMLGKVGLPWYWFMVLLILEATIATHLMIILGLNRVKEHNILQVLKICIPALVLLPFLIFGSPGFHEYSIAYSTGLAVVFAVSAVRIGRLSKAQIGSESGSFKTIFIKCFRYAGSMQLAAVAQILNFRASYYAIEVLSSPSELALARVGIFSAAMQVSESVLHFSRSVSTVQYADVSNATGRATSLLTSLRLLKLNTVVTLGAFVVLLALPESFYSWVLSASFAEVKRHFTLLAPGIMALAFSTAIAHFFAGVGEQGRNTTITWIGLGITLIIIYPLVSRWGTEGAAMLTSVVFVLQASLLVAHLWMSDRVSPLALMPTTMDLMEWRAKILQLSLKLRK